MVKRLVYVDKVLYHLAMVDPHWLDRSQWPWAGHRCPLPDGALHYLDEGQGPAVVLVHGTPTWGFEWRHVIADLSRRHRVIVPDHLGFGLSDRPADADYRPEAHAIRFATFMARVAGPEPVSLVVHDIGGPIALAWALAHPDRVRTLTVVNSWMWSFEDDPVMRRRAGMVSGRIGRLLYRHANASLRLIMPTAYADRRRLTRAVHGQYLAPFAEADGRERVLFAIAKALLGSSAFYADLWSRRARLAGVDLSLIWGMRDTAFGPSILDRWTEAFPQARVTRIADAGHWPHEEQPAAVIGALHSLLPREA
jgi:haloalkane dehalogenase